ncbi:7TM chemoreceptor [Necator americanus]|uniref:7TM chemoreceptor n=1 Tax=Necator americanus TaxID=51031 RepID=W2TEU9_NECAM|nr:7TM chemoreceptor [Necator americanus]ETN80585.1 7TM chemoreceptor [Necator americanus]
MLFNGILLYLVVFKTPKFLRVYAILIGNSAIIDFFASFVSLLTQQRYYVLRKPQLSHLSLKIAIAVIAIPSILQFAIVSGDNYRQEYLISILADRFPQYNVTGETISGHRSVFEWPVFTAILHMTLPITPVYICILILRRRIVSMLSKDMMSKQTRKIHAQLLKAITYQACLPIFFLLGVISYGIGQLGLYNHPMLESFTFLSFGMMPMLTPLLSLYFIRPYRDYTLARFFGFVTKNSSTNGTTVVSTIIHERKPK